jgi:hypothetical protein
MDRVEVMSVKVLQAAIRRSARRMTDDRGAILVFTALGLVAFMAFAAVAVDLGALFATRRHAQTVVDIGALAGAQSAGADTDPAVAKQAVIDEIKAITATNLGLTALESDAAWDGCLDPDRPGEFTPLAGETPCVSFTIGMAKIRARLPDQRIDTMFAGVIGVQTLTTSASAVVAATDSKNGDILPFGTPTVAADATLGCPSDHPSGLLPCDGPSSGNFNHLQVLQWGLNPPPAPATDCQHSNAMYEDNIAGGIDHLLSTWALNPIVDDKPFCEAPNIATPPGAVKPNTGVAKSTLVNGMAKTTANYDGRLRDVLLSSDTEIVVSETVDNTPLWEFIGNYGGSTDILGIPWSCQGPTFAGISLYDWDEDFWVEQGLDPVAADPESDGNPAGDTYKELPKSFEHMARCLRDFKLGEWQPGLGPTALPVPYAGAGYTGAPGSVAMFTRSNTATSAQTKVGVYDLQLTPRWGWSPVGDFGSGASDPFKISTFIPIYLNTLVGNCTAGSCSWIWHAGDGAPPGDPNGNKIDSLISFQLPKLSLPSSVIEYGPGSDIELPYTLIE